MDLTLKFIITFITISKSACNYAGCSPEATCDVEFVVGAVYGCGGVWSVPGIENGEYLCGDGYSICDDYIYASSLGLTEELCLNSTLLQPNYFYASLQSSSGNLICDDIGFDDVFGCASYESDPDLVYFSDTIQCGPFGAQVGTSKVTAWQYGWYTGQDSTKELQTTIHTTSENANVIMGGVLCCKEMQSYSTTNTYTTYQPEYIRSVSCDDVLSGNIRNGEIDSYNFEFESYHHYESVYVISDCETDVNIKFIVYQIFDNNQNILAHSEQFTYWVQCGSGTQYLDFMIFDINTTYAIDIYTEYNSHNNATYDIYLSCGNPPDETISADCYIGCGESVSGYYENGRPHFCEITSFTKGFGGNIFSGCFSNYDGHELRIYPDDIRSDRTWDDEKCMDDFQRLNWFVWNDTQTYYLQIDGYYSGNYTVSMECGVPTNLSGEIHCPYATMTGSLKQDEVAWYEVYFNPDLPATFDGCSSDDGIRIHLYDSELFDASYRWDNRDSRCIGDSDYYEFLHSTHNDMFYIEITNNNNEPIDAAYNVSYFCDIKRRKSTNYGSIACGDFVSGMIDIGDAHLYTFNSTMDDRIYIVSDCDTHEIAIDFFDGYSWQTSWNDYNWQCNSDTPYISNWITYGDNVEFEVFRKDNTISAPTHYGFDVYCGAKPSEPMVYGGRIKCGDQNILATNNMFFNFSNLQTQTVTFSVCSISFNAVLNLNESNGNVIISTSTNEWSYYSYNDPNKDCPHLTVQSLSVGNYTFESKREWESGIFLLDVLCDIEYVPPNTQTLQSYIVDDSCNYFVRDDSIMPMDVCFGSSYGKDGGWSQKYTCVNGTAVLLAYNTSNCDSVPIYDDDTNATSAVYNCNATNSCPYVLMTHYPLAYDKNINDYVCSPNMSAWHKGGEVIDSCRIRMNNGFTSSIVEYNDGNLTESHYVGYNCGLTAPNQNEYIYHKNVLTDHHCCGEDDHYKGHNCEKMSEAGTYIIIDYHSNPSSTSPTQKTTSYDRILTTATHATILVTRLPTKTTFKTSDSTDANMCFIITLQWVKILMLVHVSMIMSV